MCSDIIHRVKYLLAIISKILELFGKHSLIVYDIAVGLPQQSAPVASGKHSSSKAIVSALMHSTVMCITIPTKQRIIQITFKVSALRTLKPWSTSLVLQMHSLLSSTMQLSTIVLFSSTSSSSNEMTTNTLTLLQCFITTKSNL